jgi:hypothetical protein
MTNTIYDVEAAQHFGHYSDSVEFPPAVPGGGRRRQDADLA